MSDNCPLCLHTEARPDPPYERPTVTYRCSACGHVWMTSYDPEAYGLLNDTMPRRLTEPA